jgi:hypothetical protein
VPPRSKEEYYCQWKLARQGDQRAIILEPYLTFGGGGYGKEGFGNKKGASESGYTKIIRECHRLLRNTAPRITALDWRDIGLERLTGNDVVFLAIPGRRRPFEMRNGSRNAESSKHRLELLAEHFLRIRVRCLSRRTELPPSPASVTQAPHRAGGCRTQESALENDTCRVLVPFDGADFALDQYRKASRTIRD